MNWQPIEIYDKLKQKPKYVIFWVAEKKNKEGRDYAYLPAGFVERRCWGNRTITHFMTFDPPKD